jgi:D-alanine-D-alanine ligase-like ATP-grasp enzyme
MLVGVGVGVGVEVDVDAEVDDVGVIVKVEDEVRDKADVLVAADVLGGAIGIVEVSLKEDMSVFVEEADETKLDVVAEDETSELAGEDIETTVEEKPIDAVVDVEDITRVSTAMARGRQLIRTAINSGGTHHRRCC